MAISSPSCLCTIRHVHSDRDIAGGYEGGISTCPQTNPRNSKSSILDWPSVQSVSLHPNAPITCFNHYESSLLCCTKRCLCIPHHQGKSNIIHPIFTVDPGCAQFLCLHKWEQTRHHLQKTCTWQQDEGQHYYNENCPHQGLPQVPFIPGLHVLPTKAPLLAQYCLHWHVPMVCQQLWQDNLQRPWGKLPKHGRQLASSRRVRRPHAAPLLWCCICGMHLLLDEQLQHRQHQPARHNATGCTPRSVCVFLATS